MRTNTANEKAQAKRGVLDGLASLSNRILISAKDRAEAKERAFALSQAPSVEDRQEELMRFYKHYEDLVEILCDSAQYGPTAVLEERYAYEREWIGKHYADVRKFVVAYLRYSVDDAQQGLDMGGASADAFEALIAARDLKEFLEHDDGGMIDRITRTREALVMYGSHLRQLG